MTDLPIELIDFAEFLADEARKISKAGYRSHLKVEIKDDESPVTEIDKKIEETITKLVKNNFPEHSVLGEEYGHTGEAECTWIIDPIDGTKSFITGRAIFGTLIALVKNDKPILGIIDQPIQEERWLGVNGVTKFNNKIMKARSGVKLPDAIFATTSPFLFDESGQIKISKITRAARFAVYGGDCYSYGQLASGLVDIVVESGLKPYDFAALIPIIENAGGKITDWEGKPLDINSTCDVIACGDPALHKQLLDSYF